MPQLAAFNNSQLFDVANKCWTPAPRPAHRGRRRRGPRSGRADVGEAV